MEDSRIPLVTKPNSVIVSFSSVSSPQLSIKIHNKMVDDTNFSCFIVNIFYKDKKYHIIYI